MKKRISILLSFLMIFSLTLTGFAETNEIKVQLNGEIVSFDVAPQVINGTTFLPARAIVEKLGGTIEYVAATKTVTVKKDGTVVTLQVDNKLAKVEKNGEVKEITLNESPKIINGATLVPVRFLSEALDTKVGWDEFERTVVVIDYNEVVKSLDSTLKSEAPAFYEFLNSGYKQPNTFNSKCNFSIDFKSTPNTESVDNYSTLMMMGALQGGFDVTSTSSMNDESLLVDMNIKAKGMVKEFLNNEAFGLKGLDDINVKVLFNDKSLYIQSDVFNKVEDLKSLNVGDKWVKFDISEEDMASVKQMIEMIKSDDTKPIDALYASIKNPTTDLTVDTYESTSMIAEILPMLLGDDNFKVSKAGNTKTYTLNIDSDDFIKLITDISSKYSDEDINKDSDFLKFKDALKFNYDVKIEVKDDYVTGETIDMNLDFDSEEDGKFNLGFKLNSSASDINSDSIKIDVPADSETIDSKVLENKGL
ncbi:copper amine oxidase N-terminal domain-containing protein [Tepidibacter hydrothermalis]|uniref:Copper amine oxidase N-terminal domain-containing protein n=1 Tax=Tepidibacter hydrothermalis TaxID=3036126 RepID=A0ABY8EG59_9FIRM|nr:copper amine oxidase N-terminal domain-containing protein [Tepidibacter hydrothermalis]WFD10739.1 copper amine oxidase N-terminal domain-containing protein [Tepidibacter hydrothermalis]